MIGASVAVDVVVVAVRMAAVGHVAVLRDRGVHGVNGCSRE